MKKPTSHRKSYCIIEGPIGVGKTSLAQIIHKKINSKLILETFIDNPFLEKFYQDMNHYAFQTQIFFLINRFKQQQEISEFILSQHHLITDYLFNKDKIFAYLTLNDQEVKIYETIFASFQKQILKPDFLIYLTAKTETLMTRIKKRNRDFEANINSTYIHSLSLAYEHFFHFYSECPVYKIDTDQYDFIQDISIQEEVISQITSLMIEKKHLKNILVSNDSVLERIY